MLMKRLAGSLSVLALMLPLLPGCNAPYVNIPEQTGDVASANPNTSSVRDVTVASFERVLLDRDVPMPVRVELPAGSDSLTYAAVAARLDEFDVLTPADQEIEPASHLVLEGVRIRGWNAEVDVRRPATGGAEQMVTVYLRRSPFTGWAVEYTRPWRGAVSPRHAQQDDAAQ